MKQNVFISHSTQNAWMVDDLMKLIYAVNPEARIFCSSEESSLEIGTNWKDRIYESLSGADVFIAIISREYWKSKYCIFELGAVYERYCNTNDPTVLIQPLLLPPLDKGQALANTPLVEMQLADLTSAKSIALFLRHFTEDQKDPVIDKLNVGIARFCTMIRESTLRMTSLSEGMEAGAFFDERGKLPVARSRIANCRRDEDRFEFTFDLSLLDYEDDPSFASVALMYWDDVNLREYLSFDTEAAFRFNVDNRAGILKKLSVEFKSSIDSKKFVRNIDLVPGENAVRIPLKDMNYKPLSSIREICFVIHPADMNGLSGEVVFSNIHVDFKSQNILSEEEDELH